MYLPGIENDQGASGRHQTAIAAIRSLGIPVPQILHLLAYKPEATKHLDRFTQEVMRGPSPLSPGFRELIAAFTSVLNHCPF